MTPDSQSLLHIVSSQRAGLQLNKAYLPGDVLIWQDILFEGPVPAQLRREELHRIRAEFLAERGWVTHFKALADFSERDHKLGENHSGNYVLWFEANLNDQLLLLQLLDTLSQLKVPPEQISVIPLTRTAARQSGLSLERMLPREFSNLFAQVSLITPEAFTCAKKAWQFFCAKEPTQLLSVGDQLNNALPHVSKSFARLAQEYPSTKNGLSLSQSYILSSLASKSSSFDRLFQTVSDMENDPSFSETIYSSYVASLLAAPTPAIMIDDQPLAEKSASLSITDAGRAILAEKKDYLALNSIERWLGGVHLSSGKPGWRYNDTLVALMPSLM